MKKSAKKRKGTPEKSKLVIRKKKVGKDLKPKKKAKKAIKRIRVSRKALSRFGRKSIKKSKKLLKKPKRIKIKRQKQARAYIGKGILEQLFESYLKVRVLRFFFRNYGSLFTPKQIFRHLRGNPSLIRREINKLEKLGLIKHKKAWLDIGKRKGVIKREKRVVYFLNSDFDFFHELKNLFLKSAISSKQELINKIRRLGNIKILLLAGIFTGDDTAKADILIVGDKINFRRLNNFFKDLEAEVGKELNCAVMSTKEFNYRYDMYDRFIRDLLNGKSEILINKINLW